MEEKENIKANIVLRGFLCSGINPVLNLFLVKGEDLFTVYFMTKQCAHRSPWLWGIK